MKLSNIDDDEFDLIWFFMMHEVNALTEEKIAKYKKSSAGRFLLDQLDKFSRFKGGMYISWDTVETIKHVMKLKKERGEDLYSQPVKQVLEDKNRVSETSDLLAKLNEADNKIRRNT